MSDVWRCSVCHKVKDLHGNHLDGKNTVRSDCWPCAKKTSFACESATAAAPSASGATSNTAKGAVPTSAFANIFAAATEAGKKTIMTATTTSTNVFTQATPAGATTSRSGSRDGTASNTLGGNTKVHPAPTSAQAGMSRSSSNPFLTPAASAASVRRFQESYASAITSRMDDPRTTKTPQQLSSASSAAVTAGAGTGLSTPSSSAHSPYVMEAAAEGISPPFTFRPNANYSPGRSFSTASWPSPALLPTTTSTACPTWPPVQSVQDQKTEAAGDDSSVNTNASGTRKTESVGSASSDARTAVQRVIAATQKPANLFSTLNTGDNSKGGGDGHTEKRVWMCEHCHKVKDLHGDHLKERTTVRSDCWPCAKKRTFVLMKSSDMMATRAPVGHGTRSSHGGHTTAASAMLVGGVRSESAAQPFSNPFAAALRGDSALASTSSSAQPTTAAAAGLLAGTGTTSHHQDPTAEGNSTRVMAHAWATPAIPSSATTEAALLFDPSARAASILPEGTVTTAKTAIMTRKVPQPSAVQASSAIGAAVGDVDAATYYAAVARFNAQLLNSFRERLVRGLPPRAVWYQSVLYVIADDARATLPMRTAAQKDANGVDMDVVEAFAELGHYAALFLAVERKLSESRFRHIGRLFCPNELAFAAACCYTNSFFSAESPSDDGAEEASAGSACPFAVYGPQPDPTKPPSICGRLIARSPIARRCVVSEVQRVVAAQTLYRRVSWLAAPLTMTATAMQLNLESANAEVEAGGSSSDDAHAVDVVLLTGTMKLEELPQAVPLAQLTHPYSAP